MMVIMKPGGLAVAGLSLALGCAGCGGTEHGPALPARASVTPRATVRTPSFPQAADGTDVHACRDGNCEILAGARVTIPLAARFGFRTFSFDPADSTWRYTYTAGGSGHLKFLAPPYSGSWAAPTGKQSLALTVVASDGSRAVISLRPGK